MKRKVAISEEMTLYLGALRDYAAYLRPTTMSKKEVASYLLMN